MRFPKANERQQSWNQSSVKGRLPLGWQPSWMYAIGERMTNAWWMLVLAGLLEIGWAVGLKYTEGFSRLWPSVATVFCMIFSFVLLSSALKTIPVGTAYAVWTGIGAAGTAIVGMLALGESKDLLRLICLFLIVAGVVGLKMISVPKNS